MKIKGIITKKTKDPDKLYNDGNKKFESIEDAKRYEDFEVQKDSKYNRYFQMKPELNKKINQELSSFASNGTIHEKEVYDEKTSEISTTSGDTYLNSGKGFKVQPIFPVKKEEIIDYDNQIQELDINSDYLVNAKTKPEQDPIISSKIDGQLGITNIQDTNITPDPTQSAADQWKDFGSSLGKDALGSLGNTLGFTGSDLNDVMGAFKGAGIGNDKISRFDQDMNKLNTWKHNKFKEFHVNDWKPGQTIPIDLMGGDLGKMAQDIGNLPFFSEDQRGKFNEGFRKVKEVIAPDPLKTVRNNIKPSKGVLDYPNVKAEDIVVQDDLYGVGYDKANNSNAVTMNWIKGSNLFNGYNKSEKEVRVINALKNKNTYNKTLGYIYIKPYYDYGKLNTENFQIPFEFNPDISEGETQAIYATESLMNRIGQFNIYTGTNLSHLSLNLTYIALTPDELDEEAHNNMSKQFSTDAWQYYWSNNRIEEIEYKLRSLVFPDVTTSDYLIKPPLIELHIGNSNGAGADSVGDLFKYPIGIYEGEGSDKYKQNQNKYLATTRTIGEGSEIDRYKKYIVTSVQISKLNDDSFVWPSLYGRVWQNGKSGNPINHIKTAKDLNEKAENFGFSGYARRTGFKATLQCVEVVENFLDIVPDFKAYYDAWMFKNMKANYTSEYAEIITGTDHIEETTDYLNASLNTSIADISNLEDELDISFKDAYSIASLYAQACKDSGKLNAFNSEAIGNDAPDKDELYRFANPNWIEKLKSSGDGTSTAAETGNENSEEVSILEKPIFFEVELVSDIKNFIDNKYFTNWKDVSDQCNSISSFSNLNPGEQENNLIETENLKLSDDKNFGITQERLYNGNDFPNYDKDPLEYSNFFNLINALPSFTTDLQKYTKIFTDSECLLIIYYLIKSINAYYEKVEDNISRFGVPNKFDREDYSHNKILNIVKLSCGKEDIDDVSEFEEKIKDLIGDGKTLTEFFGNVYKLIEEYKEAFNKEQSEVNSKIKDYYGSHEGFIDFEKELSSISLVNITEEVLEDNYSLESLFFGVDEILKRDSLYYKGEKVLKKFKKLINNYAEAIKNINNCIMDILNCYFRYEDVLKEVETSICVAMLSNNNIKVIEPTTYSVKCSVTNANNKSIELCKVEKAADSEETKAEEDPAENKDPFKMKDYKSSVIGRKLLNVSYIMTQMINAYKKAKKNIDKLDKELERFPLRMNSNFKKDFDKIFELKFIDFNSKDKDNSLRDRDIKVLDINSIVKNKKKDIDSNLKTLVEMLSSICNLKKKLNKDGIQKNFDKVAGNYFDENDKSKQFVVENLKPLKDSYKEYSESVGSIRKLAFKEWDDAMEQGLKDPSIGFRNEEYGIIPNLYYKINRAQDYKKKMQVAGNKISINNIDKLGG